MITEDLAGTVFNRFQKIKKEATFHRISVDVALQGRLR